MSVPVNRRFILVLVCVAQFMVLLDATIVNVALPSIQHGLHFSASSLQWVVNVYTLFFGGFLLLGGRASDLFGRQRLFMAGLAVFTIASLVNGLAGSSGVLVAGRAFQGLGAALVSPAALSIVMTTFAEGRERSRTRANLAMLFVMSGLFGMFYFASIYVQEILGYSPLKAGVAFVPVTVGIVIGAGLAQPAIKALGVRLVPIAGIALAALGLILLSRITVHGTYLADLFPGLMVMSIGMGLTFVPVTLIATTNIDAADSGLASGLFNTSQQVGGALGLAILSSVAASRTSAVHAVTHATALVDGYQLAFLVGAALMLSAIAVILV